MVLLESIEFILGFLKCQYSSCSSIVRSGRYVRSVKIWIDTKCLASTKCLLTEKRLPSAKSLPTTKSLAFTKFLVIYVSFRLYVQNAVSAQPCVGKFRISLVLLNFLHCNFRLWFETP